MYTPKSVKAIRTALALLDAPARRRWVALVLLSFVAAGAEALGTIALYAFIRIVAEPAAALTIPVVGELLAPLRGADDRTVVVTATLGLVAFYLFKNVFQLAFAWRQHGWAAGARAELAERAYGAYLAAPYAFHLRRNSAELIRNVTTAVDAVFRHVLVPAMGLATETLVVLAIGGVLFVTAPGLTLGLTVGLGSAGALLLAATRSRAARWGAEFQRLERDVLQGVQQTLGAAKEIKVLGRERFFFTEFVERQAALVGVKHRSEMLATIPRVLVETVFVMAALGVVLLATLLGRTGGDLVPLLGLYAYAGFRMIPSANRLLLGVNEVRAGSAAVELIAADIALLTTAPRPPDESLPPLPFEQSLELEHVSFAYEGADREALHDVSLAIRRGESVGVVGPTGAGKSTLVDVLIGLLTPTAGRILVDGRGVPDPPRAWQRTIGYVPQSVVLIDDSLRRNIALGIPDGEVDEARLADALRMAQLGEFVAGLQDGLQTTVGERGVRLSGGQRQRVGIARALYHAPSLLVFDEATSALDNQTEATLLAAIEALRGTRTLIVVAHRLSSVRPCDRLVLLVDGRVAASGRYEDLLRDSPAFRQMAGSEPGRSG